MNNQVPRIFHRMPINANFFEHRGQRLIVVILLVGAALRWLNIGRNGFWYDEALSALIAQLSATQILANAAASDHPPGYYLLLHFWLSLESSEVAIRSLSALFSLGAIILVFGLGQWLFDRSTALVAAIAMATLPFQVYFAQEVRMYSGAVFFAAAIIWLFLYGLISHSRWYIWLGYAFAATVGLYFHYFTAFLVIGLHVWFILNFRQFRNRIWPLLTANGVIALLFLAQLGQALNRTTAYLTGVAWQSSPSVLSPLTTVYYLLFGHRTPIWLFPFSLFLVLTILILTLWESRRRPQSERNLELALWLSLSVPIIIVLIISWGIRPIYLERSFAVTSPALVLLLAHGIVAAPRLSPTRFLAFLLMGTIIVTLTSHILTPDPAKPPVREAARITSANFAAGDVNLHLQDASFMPAVWYAPTNPNILIDVPGAASTVVATHQLFGGDVLDWQTAVQGADRLWLTVMPGYTGPEQEAVHQAIEATYPQLMMKDWGAVQLYLYDLRGTE